MAYLAVRPAPGDWPRPGTATREEVVRRHEESYQRLWEECIDAARAGRLEGIIMRFDRLEDGYALYRVARTRPWLVLEHIPYGNAWTVSEDTIRGLGIADVRAHAESYRRWLDLLDERAFFEEVT